MFPNDTSGTIFFIKNCDEIRIKEVNLMRDLRGKDKELNWIPERNMVHGFTFKGFFILIIFIVIGSLIKYLFF